MAPLTRKIGNAKVSAPGLGCMGMSGVYTGAGDDEGNIKTLKAAYDMGVTLLDTADIYGQSLTNMGENERLIGRAIKEMSLDRSKLFIATKFGCIISPEGAFSGALSVRGDPEYVEEAIGKSLKNLDLSYVDLYYQHRVDPNTPIEVTVKALAKLREAGKIKHIGLSECSADTLRKANKVAKIDAVQVEYSLFETGPETSGLLDTCKELGITLVAYSPLGRGMLSGRYKSAEDFPEGDYRRFDPRYSAEHFPKNLELVAEVNKLAAKKGCTASQLALAWVHAQWEDIVTIPGTVNIDRLKENVGSAQVELSKAELTEIRSILKSFPVVGERYSEALMDGVNI